MTGANTCQVCGSADLEVVELGTPDRYGRTAYSCRKCGASVMVSHWVIRRSAFASVVYVAHSRDGRIIAYAHEGRSHIPYMITRGMTPLETSFAVFKLLHPEDPRSRAGRLHIEVEPNSNP